MSLLVVYFCISVVGLWCQLMLLRHRPWRARLAHLLLALLVWMAFVPVLLNFEKRRLVPLRETEHGLVLLDRSASAQGAGAIVDKLKARLSGPDAPDVQWLEFSEGLLPPAGNGVAGGTTNITKALSQLSGTVEREVPDWIWLVTDGGDTGVGPLPAGLAGAGLYLSALPQAEPGPDVGVAGITTDPVWYVRTATTIHADIYRNATGPAAEVDVLCLVDGVLVATRKARFEAGAASARVSFDGQSDHLGAARIEVAVAEGQGGALAANDRLLHQCQVIRDKIRILRVVGRPTWSSKFLRDNLLRREDVDLIDFHILRSMRDRVLASNQDLALIPFPVEELFVDNINSFDLIIWQNFDSDTYPFFKRQYILNIKKFVKNGGGLLLWSGSLPWDFSVGDFKELAPVLNKGEVSRVAQGRLQSDENHGLLTPRLRDELQGLGEISLNVFPGPRSPGITELVKIGGETLIGLREVDKGRVAQINTDELWNLEFNATGERSGLYAGLLGRILLWLQRDPDLMASEFEFKGAILADAMVDIALAGAPADGAMLEWEKDGVLHKNPLAQGALRQQIRAPSRPGVYQVGLTGGQGRRLASVQSLAGEYLPAAGYARGLARLEELGFTRIDLLRELPGGADGKGRERLYRNTGHPWHAGWPYLLALIGLIFLHWILLSRAQAGAHAQT